MRLIFLYLSKSFFYRKTLSFFVLISLTFTSLLTILSMNFTNTIKNFQRETEKDLYGNSDFILRIDGNRNENFGNIFLMEELKENFQYVISSFVANGFANNNDITNEVKLMASSPDEVNQFSYYKLKEKNLDDNEVIIGKSFAKKMKLNIGDNLNVIFYNIEKSLLITSIEDDYGIFNHSGSYQDVILINHTTMRYFFNFGMIGYNKYLFNIAFFKVKENLNIEENLKLISDIYPDFLTTPTKNDKYAQDFASIFAKPALIGFNLAIILSFFVVFYIFCLFYNTKEAEIKVLRKLGLSKKGFYLIILSESFIFAILSALLGALIYILSGKILFSKYFSFSLLSLNNFFTFFLILSISFLSSLFATKDFIRTKKIKAPKKHPSLINFLIICILLIFSALYFLNSTPINAFISFIFILLTCLLIVPRIFYISILLLRKVTKGKLKFIFLNLKNRTFNTHSALVIFLFGLIVIMIMNIGLNLCKTYSNYMSKEKQILLTEIQNPSEKLIDSLNEIDEITSFYPSISFSKTVLNKNEFVFELQGIKNSDIEKLFQIEKTTTKKLESFANPIILSNYYERVKKYKISDIITVEINAKIYEFEIVGFFDTTIKLGKLGIVPLEKLREITNSKLYSTITINTDNPVLTYETLKTLVNQKDQPKANIGYTSIYYSNILELNLALQKVLQIYMLFTALLISLTLFLNLSLLELAKSPDYRKEKMFGMTKMNQITIIFMRLILIVLISISLSFLTFWLLEALFSDLIILFGEYFIINDSSFSGMIYLAGVFVILLGLPLSYLSLKETKKLDL